MSAGVISRRTVLIAASLPAAGCSLLPTPKMPQIYRLSPQVDDPPGKPIPHSELTIDLPNASQSLDTDRIALTEGRIRFDYYADSVWTDRLPWLLQAQMIAAFETDGRIAQVGREVDGLGQGYRLRTEIRRFEAQYASPPAGPPNIAVVLELQLSTGSEGRIVGHRLIAAQARAAKNELNAIIAAFDAAAGDALARSVAWTIQAISADRTYGRHR